MTYLSSVRRLALALLLIAIMTASTVFTSFGAASAHNETAYCGHDQYFNFSFSQWVFYRSGSGSGTYHTHRYDHHIRTSIWGYTYDHDQFRSCPQ